MPTDPTAGVPRFLTVADVAELLNVEVAEVDELIRTAELPALRIGTQWRVEREQLDGYIEAMYEEQRRHALWEQSDFASLPELSGSRIVRTPGQARFGDS